MPGKRTIIITFLLALILFVILDCLYVYTLPYAVSLLVEKYARNAGVHNIRCRVKNIGLTGIDIGPLYIGTPGQPALFIGDLAVRYSPIDLMAKRIRWILVSGVTIRGQYADGKFTMPGLDLQSFFATQHPERKALQGSPDSALPISIDEISIRNVLCDLVVNGKRIIIPLDLSVNSAKRRPHVFGAKICVDLHREIIVVNAELDVLTKALKLDVCTDNIQLERFGEIAAFVPGLMVSGKGALRAHASCLLSPFTVLSSNASLTLQDARITYGGASVSASEPELSIAITGTGETNWKMTVSPFSLFTPLPVTVSDTSGDVRITDTGVTITGRCAATVQKTDGDTQLPINVLAPIHAAAQFTAAYANNSDWKGSGILRANMADISIDTVQVTLPEFSLTGTIVGSDKSVQVDGEVNVRNVKLSDASSEIKAEGINASIPLAWPCKEPGKAGFISLYSLKWAGCNLVSTQATVRQKGMGLFIQGTGRGVLLPGLTLDFSGAATFTGTDGLTAEAAYNIKKPAGGADVDVGKIVSEFAGIAVNGSLEAAGDFLYGAGGIITCTLKSTLKDGTLRIKEKGISVEGINAGLFLPDLLALESAPKQPLTVTRASIGEISLQDVSIDYQIESLESLLIEKCSFGWCDGKVYAQAMRISPGVDEYDVMLYCDRLKLTKLLEQFGAAYAKGEGTLNGRIPLSVKNGKLRIDDGFLFSTPGDGGTIQITDTEKLTVGIPRDAPQFAQIELAREALKDFDYQWAKLHLTSEGEDLLLKLQVDGKPASPLPFVYKKELGGFARVEPGEQGSHFQGIHLDVNFRLPIDTLIRYGKKIGDML